MEMLQHLTLKSCRGTTDLHGIGLRIYKEIEMLKHLMLKRCQGNTDLHGIVLTFFLVSSVFPWQK